MTSTGEEEGAERGRRLQPFASFRIRDYRWLWAANLTHGAFQGTQSFAIVWLTIEMLDGDGFRLGLVELAMALPILLFGLLAGRLADRRDRRLLLMTSHIVVALFLLLTALLVAANVLSLGLVFVLAFLAAVGSALGEPVRLALIPALVPKERLLNANALDNLGLFLGAGAGAGLQAVILRFWAIEGAFLLQAIVVGAGVLFLIPLRVPPREPAADNGAAAEPERPSTMRGDIAEGFRFLWRTVELRLLFVLLLTATLVGPWLAFHLTKERLDLEVFAQVVLNLTLSGGAVVTIIVLTAIPRVRNAGRWYGLVIIASSLLAVAVWLSPVYLLTALLMSLIGLGLGFRWLVFLTMVQSHTPITVMGRVMGIYLTLTAAAGLLARPITRAGQALLEDGGWIVFAAIVLAGVTAFVLVRSPSLRRMPSHPEPDASSPAEPGSG